MTSYAYALIGLTALVAGLVAVLVFAIMRFAAAARGARRTLGQADSGSAVMSAALEEALARLKAQERATAARAEASERLSGQIVAGLTSGLIVVDGARAVKIVNPAARRILRGDANHGDDASVLDEVPALNAVIVECLAERAPVIRRAITITRGDETRHLGVTVSPLTGGSENESEGAICLFSDLTAVVALEEQLRLKETLARLGELTAGLAHEFRNGLATIHGYARLLDPETLPHPQCQYVEGLRSETAALGELVTNFLNFARPEPLSCLPTDLRVLVERTAEEFPAATVTLNGDFGAVDADEVLLRRAFNNLIRNSVEACSAASRTPHITIDARRDSRDDVVVLSVRDNGPGIPPEALDKIFQPFFTMRPGGTGLGLAIVQKVIVSHNGRVSAGNHADGGAMFTIELPQSQSS